MAPDQSPTTRRIAIISLTVVCALLVLAIFAALRLPTFHPYAVSQSSMEPTLYQGDKILVNQDYYSHHAFADGDLLVFRHGDALLIKRISALAGETIEGKDEGSFATAFNSTSLMRCTQKTILSTSKRFRRDEFPKVRYLSSGIRETTAWTAVPPSTALYVQVMWSGGSLMFTGLRTRTKLAARSSRTLVA
jgi:signal peptidase I